MSNEVVLQVKVSGADVHRAVRNLLLNEFKVIPDDLVRSVNQRLDNLLQKIVQDWINSKYGGYLEQTVRNAVATAEKTTEQVVKDALLTVVREQIHHHAEGLVRDLFKSKGDKS